MILETLLGGGIGALARLAPEIIRLLDRGNERKHEIALLDRNLAADKARGERSEREFTMQTELAQVTQGLAAMQEALRGQFQLTGIKWVDAVNQTVRPFLTYGIVAPYAISKLVLFVAVLWASGLNVAAVQAALAAAYSGADYAILSGILNFYFLGRVFDKRS